MENEDGLTSLKDKDCNLKVEIDSKKKTIADIMEKLDLEKIIDINISSVPLEEIITNIYKGEKALN